MVLVTRLRSLTIFCITACFGLHALHAAVINVPQDAWPTALTAGDTWNIYDGATVPPALEFDFVTTAAGSTINAYGGAHGGFVNVSGTLNVFEGHHFGITEARHGSINLFGGSVDITALFEGSVLNLNGGRVNGFFTSDDSTINLHSGALPAATDIRSSTLNMSGGEFRLAVNATPFYDESIVNMSGGVMSDSGFRGGAIFNLSGGLIGGGTEFDRVLIEQDARLNLTVREALLDGNPIVGLTAGQSVIVDVSSHEGTLAGVLADGSPFTFVLKLSDNNFTPGGVIYTNLIDDQGSPAFEQVEISISMVPEPEACALAIAAIVVGYVSRRCHRI